MWDKLHGWSTHITLEFFFCTGNNKKKRGGASPQPLGDLNNLQSHASYARPLITARAISSDLKVTSYASLHLSTEAISHKSEPHTPACLAVAISSASKRLPSVPRVQPSKDEERNLKVGGRGPFIGRGMKARRSPASEHDRGGRIFLQRPMRASDDMTDKTTREATRFHCSGDFLYFHCCRHNTSDGGHIGPRIFVRKMALFVAREDLSSLHATEQFPRKNTHRPRPGIWRAGTTFDTTQNFCPGKGKEHLYLAK